MNNQPPPAYGPPPMPAPPQSCGLATASLVCGIVSMVMCGPLTGIPAVICGHKAKRRIAESRGQLTGEGLALAGLIMGYLSLAWLIVIVPMMAAIAIPSFVRARSMSQVHACANNLRLIDAAKEQWALDNDVRAESGRTPTAGDLAKYLRAGMPTCPAGGQYAIAPVGQPPTCSINGHALTTFSPVPQRTLTPEAGSSP